MKKSSLALVIPAVLIGASVAGAWYTGTRLESELNRALQQANTALSEQAPELDASVTLLSLERGIFSSQARYQVQFTVDEGESTQTLLISDRLEHGPFPVSRLLKGRLLPVMAQSNYVLEQNDTSAPLFAAADGQVPLSGEAALHYNLAHSGQIRSAALNFAEDGERLSLSPAQLSYSVSGDQSHISLQGELPKLSAQFSDEESAETTLVELSQLALEMDKTNQENGFALGPSQASIAQLSVTPPGEAPFELHDLLLTESLTVGAKGLDQTLGYRLDKLTRNGQTLFGGELQLSLLNLDQQVLEQAQSFFQAQVGREDEELTAEQQAELQRLGLAMLDKEPVLAIDNLSIHTANGKAQASLRLDLAKPANVNAPVPLLVEQLLRSLKLDVTLDKAVIEDVAALQQDSDDEAATREQAKAMADMFSGLALQTQWAVQDGDALKSALSYAGNQITLNGQTMSREQFIAFAMGSMFGLSLGMSTLEE